MNSIKDHQRYTVIWEVLWRVGDGWWVYSTQLYTVEDDRWWYSVRRQCQPLTCICTCMSLNINLFHSCLEEEHLFDGLRFGWSMRCGCSCDTLYLQWLSLCVSAWTWMMAWCDLILEEQLEEESWGQHHLEEHIEKYYILRRRFRSFVAFYSSPMSSRRRHVIFAVSSQTETEDTHHNTATPSKERRRGRTAKDSGKEGDGRELHVGRGWIDVCVCLVDETELWALCWTVIVRSSSSDMPKGNIVLFLWYAEREHCALLRWWRVGINFIARRYPRIFVTSSLYFRFLQ